MGFAFDNTYARDLPGFSLPVTGDPAPAPRLIRLNRPLADELRLTLDENAAAIFAGAQMPEGAASLAMAYAGHQFGGFSPQLGDGRALLLGEVIDRQGQRRDIHLKGSGRTPFSRGGDGKAVLGPVLREYIIGEAMHALGIPTTRALAAVTTGAQVLRETGLQPGAVLTRVAASHLRVGTFQFFAARGEVDKLQILTAYALNRHYPDLARAENPALALLRAVGQRQADLIARWMAVGFVHGVMNTDNMTISGETIDYGPCAFLDTYDPRTVFSSIDQQGRYAYANQPGIARWNLARLAEALLPLIDADEARAIDLATVEIDAFTGCYHTAWLAHMGEKLGLPGAADAALVDALLAAMEGQGVDFTRFFRLLALASSNPAPVRALFADPAAFDDWLPGWLALAPDAEVMNRANPVYIPRNHMVEAALTAATAGDLGPFETLLDVVSQPFNPQPSRDAYALGAPSGFGPYRTFCGT